MIVVRSTSGLDNELSFVLQCFAVIDLSRDENFSSAAVQAIVRVKRAESRRRLSFADRSSSSEGAR